jgi:hypothetical protein
LLLLAHYWLAACFCWLTIGWLLAFAGSLLAGCLLLLAHYWLGYLLLLAHYWLAACFCWLTIGWLLAFAGSLLAWLLAFAGSLLADCLLLLTNYKPSETKQTNSIPLKNVI